MRFIIPLLLFLTCTPAFADQPTAASNKDSLLKSPSGNVAVQFSTSQEGRLQYSVRFKGREVVELSPLGITVDGIDLGRGTAIGVPHLRTTDQTYQTRGKHTQARNHYRQWRFPIHNHGSARDYTIEFRIYDDGVALRYEVPGETIQHVDGESSSWTIVEGSKTWYFERLNRTWKLKSYAGEWLSTDISNLSTASPPKLGPVQGTPLVFELPEGIGYAAITKAALYNYSGMRLKAVGDRRVVADFVEGAAGFDVNGTIVTPWRVTMLANDLDALVNSNLISNLNPAPAPELFADVSYIRPGRSVWSWETLGLDSVETQRTFIDLAAELGFEYSIVDDGWKDWPEPWQSITALCDHGSNKNVGVWVWSHSQDIDDPIGDYQIMRRYLQQVAKAGAVGVKIDFMNGESKRLVDFEIAALRIAAENRLMVNFHGCHASTGESRTWPNEMTREGIRGMEVNKMKEGPLPASHNAALPFTRFVVGHGDYTPILYSNPGPTTCAHQLATTVIFDSPLQIYAEHPDTMMESPDLKNACEVTKSIPTVWDETIVLPGSKIGEIAAFARRSDDKWFVGILNGGDQRAYQLKFDFLDTANYNAHIVQDDLNRAPISVADVGINTKATLKQWTTTVPFKVSQRSALSAQSKMSVELATGGGLVIVLTPTVKN